MIREFFGNGDGHFFRYSNEILYHTRTEVYTKGHGHGEPHSGAYAFQNGGGQGAGFVYYGISSDSGLILY